MTKRTDPLSLPLFGQGEAAGEAQPGLSEIQVQAVRGEIGDVLQQPMQSVALRPTNGQLTKGMLLVWLKIVQIVQKVPRAEVYRIPFSEIAEFMETRNYDRLKSALTSLNVTQVEWNNGVGPQELDWGVTVLLSQARIRKSAARNTIEVSLPPEIDKGVRKLHQFSNLNLLLLKQLSRDAAVHLYRIAVAYESNSNGLTFRASPQEWEQRLRPGERKPTDKRFVYKYFKRDVLNPAMAEINELTDLLITMREHKEGGKTVKEIQFEVKSKTANRLSDDSFGDVSAAELEMAAALKDFGVRRTDVASLLATYGIAQVKRNVEYVRAKLADPKANIRSSPAYAKTAIQQDYAGAGAPAEPDVTIVSAKGQARTNEEVAKEVVLQQYLAHRRERALDMFGEMRKRDADEHWTSFTKAMRDNATVAAAIRTKSLEKSKMLQVHFYNWLAEQLEGPVTDDGLLKYLVEQQARPVTKRAARRA